MSPVPDPYRTLGVRPSATDAELRAAYRHLVQLHHPDHNGGSAESARKFEEVQEAYAQVRRLRGAAGATAGSRGAGSGATVGSRGAGSGATAGSSGERGNPDLDARLAAMERNLKAARDARERAVRAAREATERTLHDLRADAEDGHGRASDEDLGYVSTDDSFSKILDDAAAGVSERLSEARKTSASHHVADLLDELAHKLKGDPPKPD
ncbi:MAG TPA: DnaJ domain-containing protein [Solirubrobacteraceae bacterium]|jgi:curved DNA-binding protein CbpA|nr:DnaJ domain-containing protein [Solirubrobacteraceae bacterium]